MGGPERAHPCRVPAAQVPALQRSVHARLHPRASVGPSQPLWLTSHTLLLHCFSFAHSSHPLLLDLRHTLCCCFARDCVSHPLSVVCSIFSKAQTAPAIIASSSVLNPHFPLDFSPTLQVTLFCGPSFARPASCNSSVSIQLTHWNHSLQFLSFGPILPTPSKWELTPSPKSRLCRPDDCGAQRAVCLRCRHVYARLDALRRARARDCLRAARQERRLLLRSRPPGSPAG